MPLKTAVVESLGVANGVAEGSGEGEWLPEGKKDAVGPGGEGETLALTDAETNEEVDEDGVAEGGGEGEWLPEGRKDAVGPGGEGETLVLTDAEEDEVALAEAVKVNCVPLDVAVAVTLAVEDDMPEKVSVAVSLAVAVTHAKAVTVGEYDPSAVTDAQWEEVCVIDTDKDVVRDSVADPVEERQSEGGGELETTGVGVVRTV